MAKNKDNQPADELEEGEAFYVDESDNYEPAPSFESEMADETHTALQHESPPPGVYVEGLDQVEASATSQGRAKPQPAFSDEHVGKGGRYRVNPQTGAREPIYEQYVDNGVVKYRKAY